MNQQQLRRQQLLNELYNQQQMQNYQNNKKSYLNDAQDVYSRFQKYKGMYNNAMNSGNRIASMGQNMSKFGTKLQTSSNPFLNNVGSKIGNLGTNTTNLGNNLQTGINNFRGAITPATSGTATTGATPLATGTTAANAGGTVLGTTGTTAGTAAGTGATGLASGTAGTTAGLAGTTAGTTAATTGAATAAGTGAATAAGTGAAAGAGGLGAGMGAAGGAAAAGMSAVPVVGWGLLAAAALYSMLNSARQKKNAKSLQQTMQASAQGEEKANEQTAEAMQNIANNQQQQQQQLQQQNEANGFGGLTGLTQNNPQMSQNGYDMLTAIQQGLGGQQSQGNNQDGEQNKLLSSATSILPPAIKGTPMDMLNNQISKYTGLDNNSLSFTDLLQNPLSQNGNSTQGTPTGGAAPVAQQTTTTAPVQQQPTQLSGNVTQTVDPNAQQQTPAFGSQVYQTGGGNGRIAQLMNEVKQGYKDNTENTLGNTYFAPGQKKTFANRFGEALGTGQRIASNPLVQGIIAGGVDYANGSNFGKSALTGIDWARNKANSDRYEQLINGNNKRSFLGGYTSDDYDSKVDKDYKDQQLQNAADEFQWKQDEATKKFNYQQELNKQKMELEKQKLENDKAYKNNMIALRKEQIKNGRNSGYGRTAKYDPTQNPDFYDDYDKYEAFDSMEEGTDEYNQEVDDMLEQMYGGKTPGSAWGYYSAQERANAKNEVDKIINQQKKAFMKKYRINPMTSKGKKK